MNGLRQHSHIIPAADDGDAQFIRTDPIRSLVKWMIQHQFLRHELSRMNQDDLRTAEISRIQHGARHFGRREHIDFYVVQFQTTASFQKDQRVPQVLFFLFTDEKYGNLISSHSGVERLLRRLKINDVSQTLLSDILREEIRRRFPAENRLIYKFSTYFPVISVFSSEETQERQF